MIFENEGLDDIANSAFKRLRVALGQACAGGASIGVYNPQMDIIKVSNLYQDFFHNTLREMQLPADFSPQRAFVVENLAFQAAIAEARRLPIVYPSYPNPRWLNDGDPRMNDQSLLARLSEVAEAFVDVWKTAISK
jgi:hypothetical protein